MPSVLGLGADLGHGRFFVVRDRRQDDIGLTGAILNRLQLAREDRA
jgi:hypothetical protein